MKILARVSACIAAVCFIALAAPAGAATPALSGVYAYSGTIACQARIDFTTGDSVRSATNGSVLTEASTGQVVTSLTTGTGLISTSTTQAVVSVDFGTQQTSTTNVVADAQSSTVVTGGQTTTGIIGVTSGTAVVGATTGPAVYTYSVSSGGAITEEIGTMSFAGSNVTAKKTSVKGDALKKGATAVTKTTSTATKAFSRSAVTVTIGGVVYDAVYGNIVNNVARHVNLLRQEANGCAFRGTLVHQ